jgi:hypothetical protein
MSSDSTVVVELSLVERISKIEESLKDLKRAARHELRNRRRRRGTKRDGAEKGVKGETPVQLVAWHSEVRKVWDEMRKADAKTPYKRAVAEASARRKGAAVPSVVPSASKASSKKVVSKDVDAKVDAKVVSKDVDAKVAPKKAVKKTA